MGKTGFKNEKVYWERCIIAAQPTNCFPLERSREELDAPVTASMHSVAVDAGGIIVTLVGVFHWRTAVFYSGLFPK